MDNAIENSMAELVEVVLDDESFDRKPSMAMCKTIKWRLKDVKYHKKLTVEEVGYLYSHGHTIYPSVFNGQSVSGEDWIHQQLFILDIDHELSMANAYKRLSEYKITPCFMYHTYSNAPELEKFRIVFCCKDCITDGDLRDRIQLILMALVPECDPRCHDKARIFYGGNEGRVYYADYEARFDPEDLITRFGDMEYIPQKTEKKIKEKTKLKRDKKPERSWDLSKAKALQKEYVKNKEIDPRSWGKTKEYKHNCRIHSRSLLRYFKENGVKYEDHSGRHLALHCIYCVFRGGDNLIQSIGYLICINDFFGEPLSVDEVFSIIDSCERKTRVPKKFSGKIYRGYCYGVEKIIEYCGVEDPVEYGIGVGLERRRRAQERAGLVIGRDKRIDELYKKGYSRRKIVSIMKQEGYTISLGTLQTRLKTMGYIQSKETERGDEMEV